MDTLIKYAIAAIAIVALSGCKGTDNTVRVSVDGPGTVFSNDFQCNDQCETIVHLSWWQSQLLLKKSITLTAAPEQGYEFFGWVKTSYLLNCNDSEQDEEHDLEQCTVPVQAGCADELDFRTSGIPCQTLEPNNRILTAVFVEQGSTEQRVWSGSSACQVTTSDEIRCWGPSDLENNTPVVSNPGELKISTSIGCVKSDSGFQCWGDPYYLGDSQPPLTDPEAFIVSDGFLCAIDLGQVVCWGRYSDNIADTPVLSNPTRIAFAYPNVCAIDDDGLHCWGDNIDGVQSAPIGDETFISLPNFDCTITQDAFGCERFILSR